MTPLNSKSVAWPRIRGTITPIAVPASPSVITAMLSLRCGASCFTNRTAELQKSRDRPAGGAATPRVAMPVDEVMGHPDRT